jgi:hypothetical protein
MREIPASELLRSLLDGAPTKVFDFVKVQPSGERTITKIRLRVLRIEENHNAIRASQAYAKHGGELEGYGDIYREAQAVEVLTLALCHIDKHTRPDGTEYYPPLFTDSRQLRASFNEVEMSVLLNCYQIVKSEYGALETLDEHDSDTWTARLSDELRGPFWLSRLDSLHWPGQIFHLAKQNAALRLELGRPLLISADISASAQPSSTSLIGVSSPRPSASSVDDAMPIEAGAILTRDEARQRVSRVTKPKK